MFLRQFVIAALQMLYNGDDDDDNDNDGVSAGRHVINTIRCADDRAVVSDSQKTL